MPQEFVYDKLTIGSSLEAVLFSFYNKIKLLYTRNNQPNNLEKIEDFGLGVNHKDIWDKHVFQLSIAGYIPFENKIKHIRYEDANTLKIITNEESVYTVKFNQLYVFDDYNFLDLPVSIENTSTQYRVIDWLKPLKSNLHKCENVQQDSKFMNQIIFYESNRNNKSKRKNICVISYIKKEEIDSIPEHLVKIKTEALIKELGISTIEIEHISREIFDLGKNIYEDFDNVIFVYTDAKIMYDFHRRNAKIDYMKYFRMKLGL